MTQSPRPAHSITPTKIRVRRRTALVSLIWEPIFLLLCDSPMFGIWVQRPAALMPLAYR